MLSRDKVSLNALAFESTCKLIQAVLNRGVCLVEAYIDALGDTTKHRARGQRGSAAAALHCMHRTSLAAAGPNPAAAGARMCRSACRSASQACSSTWRTRSSVQVGGSGAFLA